MRSFRSKKSTDDKTKSGKSAEKRSDKHSEKRDKHQRRSRIETFEPRHMMTANPITDVVVEPMDMELSQAVEQIEIAPALNDVNEATGVNYIHEDYGFDGSGQTIAVIDSGIAWDHYALGGGFGEGNRVVGGWDFAENDADPYDDGPAGFHGSHVAGIIGSSDAAAKGVASGADLVALRVFDDYGAGNFDWVEDSLQWVYDHRNDFENPITTVNLSLGTKWNADTVPDWASLENEFAKLEDVGIFISVAAGNSFKSYGETGLSYPAASEHVVPVGSHDADGNISDFSQRNDRILVAPGEQITSTVPEHVLGGSGAAKSFFSASGTSMATPYVAGAAALVRQAMEFMGHEDITQEKIYDTFRDTADKIYDRVTNAKYDKINVGAAIDSIVTDLNGRNAKTATDLGNVTGSQKINGTIGKLTDNDFVSFTAGRDGKISFTVDATHDLNADVKLTGGNLSRSGNTYSFDAEGGKDYTLRLGTSAGIGHYEINLDAGTGRSNGTSFDGQATDWGKVAMKSVAGIEVDGESWHQFKATRDGIVTVELTDGQSSGNVRFDIYDSKMRLIDSSISGNEQRVDFTGKGGEEYFVRFEGNADNVDARISNVLRLEGKSLRVAGTTRADKIDIDVSNGADINVNGVEYSFTKSQVNHIVVRAAGGTDSINMTGGSIAERAVAQQERFTLVSKRMHVVGINFENINIDGGGGADRLTINDSIGNDTFVGHGTKARISGDNYENTFANFERVFVNSESGNDTATLLDTHGDDLLKSRGDIVRMRSTGKVTVVDGFDSVNAISQHGNDRAVLHDTMGNDTLVSRASKSIMSGIANSGSNYKTTATGFERVSAIARAGGNDVANLFGTDGNDLVISRNGNTSIRNTNMLNIARGFGTVSLDSLGGVDEGRIFLSGSSNVVNAANTGLSYATDTGNVVAKNLNDVNLTGGDGNDSVIFSDIGRLDEVMGIGNIARVAFDDLSVTVRDIEKVTARAKAGETARAELDAIDFLFYGEGRWE